MTFLAYNTNKFLFLFERILASTGNSSVSYEQSKILAMILQSLKYYYYSAQGLSRVPGLWRDQHQPDKDKPTLHGMGLSTTIRESDYGWLLPKVD